MKSTWIIMMYLHRSILESWLLICPFSTSMAHINRDKTPSMQQEMAGHFHQHVYISGLTFVGAFVSFCSLLDHAAPSRHMPTTKAPSSGLCTSPSLLYTSVDILTSSRDHPTCLRVASCTRQHHRELYVLYLSITTSRNSTLFAHLQKKVHFIL